MKEKPIKTPATPLQERLQALMRDFYGEDDKSAVIAAFQEGKTLNLLAQGTAENIAKALLQLIRTNDDFYRIAVDVVGGELARRVPAISQRSLVDGLFKKKPKS